ncbi:MAG: FKBP-type peptidyl-prolyl cis-trans isomerase [Patescibacteria group bacterium]|mgnify:CR=1 FL=1
MPHLSKNEWVAIFASLAVIFFFVFGSAPLTSLFQGGLTQTQKDNMPAESKQGIKIEDIILGAGETATAGFLLSVHYVGTLLDGTKFDSSVDRGAPFQFILGAGQVIRGWDEGFAGMKVGGKRRLIIKPEFAYGAATGHPLEKETLIFDVELLKVGKAAQ